jgi:hypothetical protein
MKQQILEIADELANDAITTEQAKTLLLLLLGVGEQSEQLSCVCCNGTGMVEGDYRDELESCLTCNGRSTF